jgi:hypothetical protein
MKFGNIFQSADAHTTDTCARATLTQQRHESDLKDSGMMNFRNTA